jgi:hypothetical protein
LNIFLGSEKKNSVYHESDILELEDEFQLFFEEGEKNLAVGVTNITNLEIPVLKEFFNEHRLCSMSQTRIKQKKARSVNEILVNLHCLALDPFYLVGKRLNTVKQNILRFRSFSFQNITDICLKKCLQPKGIEAQLSHPGNIESELSMKVDGKQSCGEIFVPSVSYTDNPVNCLGRKRKLDEPSVSCISFKLHKTIPTTAYLQINKTGCKENSSDSFISVPALSDPSHHGHIVEIGKLQEPEERVDILNDTRACIPCVMRQETGRSVSVWEDNETCISYVCDATMIFTDGAHDERVKVDCNLSLLRPCATQSVLNILLELVPMLLRLILDWEPKYAYHNLTLLFFFFFFFCRNLTLVLVKSRCCLVMAMVLHPVDPTKKPVLVSLLETALRRIRSSINLLLQIHHLSCEGVSSVKHLLLLHLYI